MIRIFVAAEIPGAVRDVITISQNRLQGLGNRVRWVKSESAHLTLKFLGDVEEHHASDVVSEIQQSVRQDSPIILRTGKISAFPGLQNARVIWLGVEGDVKGLSRIHNGLESALIPMGFAMERRPFSPHLTLGRVRRKPVSISAESSGPIGSVYFKVDRVVVMQSELGPAGAVYTPLGYGMLGDQ